MAQFGRPAADVTVGGWVTNTGATANRFAAIDEDVADDADFVTQAAGNVNDAYEVRLSAVATPLIDRLHVVRYRYQKNQALGNVRNLQVSLLQGGTVVATGTLHADISTVWREGAFVLAVAQAAAVADYADLRLRFAASGTTSGSTARRTVQVSWAQLRVPDQMATYENDWGFTLDDATPGIVRYTDGSFVGEGPRREDALVDLVTQRRDADPTDPVRDRRWRMAYYSRKDLDYADLRAAIVAGTVPLPPHQTPAQALARCDAKRAAFAAITAAADAADRAV